ncbi:hypothetical protein COLO4_01712 [Corchorus olitorius]|uniref:Uncharacterized protein n=1 Tax=Corchorus olitorius TaxID=93759 RepID=A0A1R3L253_9ROSI|nr:hypothetical protein COLO4_01712 [Corchorus olitorius]
MMDSEYFKWYELLLAIGLSVIGYYIPFWILLFQKRMRLMEMQNEVDQFHTLISILIQFDRMDTQMILEWMERYSLIFKPALLKCLNDYDQGAEKAIMQLKEDAPYPAFVKIINRLQRSVEKIPLLYAFDDLESEQEHHREMKIERMNRVINQKVFWGKACGWTPAVFLLIFFLVGPMLYVSMMNMADMMIAGTKTAQDDMSGLTNTLQQSKFSAYDNSIVSGSQIINVVRQYMKQDAFGVTVTTGKGSTTTYGNAFDATTGEVTSTSKNEDLTNAQSQSAAGYINPSGRFLSKVVTDKNGVVRGLIFQQR